MSPNHNQHDIHPLERVSRILEGALWILLSILAIATMGGAVFLMLQMGTNSQGGRFIVAIIALVILGALDSQIQKLVQRYVPLSLTTTPQERLYSAISLLVMLVSAVLLFGLAWLLP